MEQVEDRHDTWSEAAPTDLDAVRAAIADTPSSALGGLFARLSASLGNEEASRLWMAAFSSTDATET